MLTLLAAVALACPHLACPPPGATLVERPTVEGQPEGAWRATYADGSPAWEATFRDGRPWGVERTWTRHEGERGGYDVLVGRWVDGRRHGVWRARVEGGPPISTRRFVDGEEHGVSRFWEVGALTYKERWDHGTLVETWSAWGDGWEPLPQ